MLVKRKAEETEIISGKSVKHSKVDHPIHITEIPFEIIKQIFCRKEHGEYVIGFLGIHDGRNVSQTCKTFYKPMLDNGCRLLDITFGNWMGMSENAWEIPKMIPIFKQEIVYSLVWNLKGNTYGWFHLQPYLRFIHDVTVSEDVTELLECDDDLDFDVEEKEYNRRFIDYYSKTAGISDASVFVGVKELRLQHCDGITDVNMLGSVHTLELRGCEGITDVSNLGNVYTLDLSKCSGITDVSNLGNVHKLDLSDCEGITDYKHVGQCSYIEFIWLSGNYGCKQFGQRSYIEFKFVSFNY
jgi:hypothetical protein